MYTGNIIASKAVLEEIEKDDDELKQFLSEHDQIFVDPSREEQIIVGRLVGEPDLDKWSESERHLADPFVVALANVKNMSVVSYENTRQTKNTIPVACRILDVQHFTFVEFLWRENFKF